MSFRCEKNQVIALVGPSGSGKSSVMNLIERFYKLNEGQILYSGKDISELDPKWFKNQVSIVQQEPVLFSGTIKDNIVYGCDRSKYTEEELKSAMDDACKQAQATNFINDPKQFPEGYDTVVGERGIKLSGGQK